MIARKHRPEADIFEVLHWQEGIAGSGVAKGARLALVISALDLDAHSAAQIIALNPHTVLNAEPSYSGRFPARGPVQLVAAGIELVDDLGADILTVPNETLVHVVHGVVSVGEEVLCEGEVRTLADLSVDQQEAQGGVGEKVTALVGAAALNLRSGTAALGAAIEVPAADQVLVYVPRGGARHRELRHYLAQQQPAVIAVNGGWNEALEHGLRPQYVVLSPGHLVPQTPRRYRPKQVYLLSAPGEGDRLRPVAAQLVERGWNYLEVPTVQSATHFALALAGRFGAELIVWAGPKVSDPNADLLERSATDGAAELLLRVELAGRLVDADAVRITARPPIGAGWLVGFALAGLAALAVAVSVTVFGIDLGQMLGWFDWNGGN